MVVHGSVGRVLITGINGFTGRHLAQFLISKGWDVVGLGNTAECTLSNVKEYLAVDLQETAHIAHWLAGVQPTHIIHLAALSFVVNDDPALFYRHNTLGTESLFKAISLARLSLQKLIVASSANIYGNAECSPINESVLPQPQNHYAFSKLAMEYMARTWFERLPIVIVRPFNYTGPGQSEKFVFAKIVGAFRRQEQEIKLGNLEIARDLSDISYVVEAYQRLLSSEVRHEVFNLCSGKSTALLEVIQKMSEIAGYMPIITSEAAFIRHNDIRELWGDPTKLRNVIGDIEKPSLHQMLLSMYRSSGEWVDSPSLTRVS